MYGSVCRTPPHPAAGGWEGDSLPQGLPWSSLGSTEGCCQPASQRHASITDAMDSCLVPTVLVVEDLSIYKVGALRRQIEGHGCLAVLPHPCLNTLSLSPKCHWEEA
ncbi:hypothetical protein E2C01_000058 [Portunus trituberculatus]|uniref:Uncharacterized protein n=1 Tax=Portunus trituberculatus TaxID=210409 RepID=A0A5B7CGA3_PORTR|nr:hypothetical protein [Portunus trituberculatus]